MSMLTKRIPVVLAVAAALTSAAARADHLSLVLGSVGSDVKETRMLLDKFEQQTGNTVALVQMPASTTDQFGQYRLWLSAGNSEVDVYQTDVIWAPQLASNFVDLTKAMADRIGEVRPAIVQSQMVDDKLVAMPMYTDAAALFYRTDLLQQYGKQPPKTWAELTATAREIQDGERKAGHAQAQGFVFQGASYEGLTCDALEWVVSSGGGQIVSPQGDISIDNPKAVAALDLAHSWIGNISPTGVLGYQEEEARGVWQAGNAVFMRNWPYAYALGNGPDSSVKGKFGVAPLPSGEGGQSVTCLGGWNLAVSKFSKHQDTAIQLVRFLTSKESQKARAMDQALLPTIPALYDDPDIAKAQPIVAQWKDVLAGSVPRPSAPTKAKYNEVSKEFWTSVHETLSGQGTAQSNLAELQNRLRRLKRSGW
jgi:trehalose/maltose transport system substrate-binding protein